VKHDREKQGIRRKPAARNEQESPYRTARIAGILECPEIMAGERNTESRQKGESVRNERSQVGVIQQYPDNEDMYRRSHHADDTEAEDSQQFPPDKPGLEMISQYDFRRLFHGFGYFSALLYIRRTI
jgi:hypothetical protein